MPATVVSTATAEHYTWGGPIATDCDCWYLMRSEGLHVIEERMPPGTAEARHFHQKARQFFYVLAGELTMEVEHHEFTVGVGQGIEIAPGQAHQAINRSSAAVRILVTSQPPSHGDRVNA